MWYYVSPQIVFGEDALEALAEIPGARALIVTDAVLVKLGLADRIRAYLERAGIAVTVFDAVEPDPSLQTVRQGAQVAAACQPDWIVGLGGGSAMDAAKAIWILYERPDLDPAEISPLVTLGLRKKARLITIPTTSGTGAEVTWAIVLTDTEAQRKLCLGNRENVADIAIVDPSLAVGMSPQLTADTGMDALTHAIEGYICTWHNDMSDGACIQALRTIFATLPSAVANGADLAIREKMHNAATLAGLGFGNALAALAHGLGHALGAVFHVPHGRAVGLFLPYTIDFTAALTPERCAELAALLGCAQDTPAASAHALADAVRQLSAQIGMPTSLSALGIAPAEFAAALDKLVENAYNDGSVMAAPRIPSYEELAQLFTYAYEGKAIDF